jgi:hypothetical protein
MATMSLTRREGCGADAVDASEIFAADDSEGFASDCGTSWGTGGFCVTVAMRFLVSGARSEERLKKPDPEELADDFIVEEGHCWELVRLTPCAQENYWPQEQVKE